MANVLFKRGNTATINGTAITDGLLLYNTTTGQQYIDVGTTRIPVGKPVDTALSKTSTNAIANNAITTSIVNTTAEVSAITADYIPCGTKPVKELITNLNNNTVTSIYVGADGKLHVVKAGADSVLNFSSGYHIAVLYSGTTECKLYIDGVYKASVYYSSSWTNTAVFTVGTKQIYASAGLTDSRLYVDGVNVVSFSKQSSWVWSAPYVFQI